MENLVLLGVLLVVTIIVGAFMGIFAFAEVKQLRREVRNLTVRLDEVTGAQHKAPSQKPSAASDIEVRSTAAQFPPEIDTLELNLDVDPPAQATQRKPRSQRWARQPEKRSPAGPTSGGRFFANLQKNWMVWLGGACVALSGVFLARYGIEQGMLGPKVRVVMGLVTALALYIAAEVLRRKTGGTHPTFAALAGGGAITAFAAVLSAVHLYHFIEPGMAFGALALVALVTMWLARLHGPVLAAIGMLGAYSVPILVSSDSGNVLGAMVYALIISASVLLLLRHVYRSWLWLGLLAGALLWWLVSLAGHQADGWRGPYLAVVAYLILAVIPRDWLLRLRIPDESKQGALVLPSLLLLVAAQCISILREGFLSSAIWAWSPLAIVTLLAARQTPRLAPVPWVLFLGQVAAWFANQVGGEPLRLSPLAPDLHSPFLTYLLVNTLLFSGFAVFNYFAVGSGESKERTVTAAWWASLAVMAPLLSLLLGYSLAADFLPRYLWCLYAAIFGAIFMFLGSRGVGKHWSRGMVVWLFIAAHFAYSLAVCLWLKQASLTLALALQAISLAWVIRRFDMPALGWLLKAVLLVVVARLTLNPWLLSYENVAHWSLWTYGGATLCAWIAARLLSSSQPADSAQAGLARWAEAAALHLLVLTLWAECRYWLYSGNALAAEFSFTEAVIDMWLFTCLGLVYYRKSLLSGRFGRWYDGYGRVLMLAGLACYVGILLATALSSPWVWRGIGERPLLNMLIPAFAGPVLLAVLASRYYLPSVRRFAGLLAALAAFVWVSLEVRHLWQGSIRLDVSASTGELYTYSAVWLALAVTAILLASWRGWRSCYQGGMALLALVIVKLFLVDMSGLEGLLRVASFMGMGLALLGIAYLHQKLGVKPQDSA
ncbi:DUF2339 domain-containing protein [Microbulbifer agarilyticus]|uniref:DUF2339 domain-containing protein n=1 Tax=Microbulbifer agarilyticus TaxID=260552 RepID=UPI001C977B01|nr:DUF2339 domain-containing protein [Microbulbifer agarilyticus]MBY6190587.1 DUF2339 domain-containing protein [Microbulbifer agarilyticus]